MADVNISVKEQQYLAIINFSQTKDQFQYNTVALSMSKPKNSQNCFLYTKDNTKASNILLKIKNS